MNILFTLVDKYKLGTGYCSLYDIRSAHYSTVSAKKTAMLSTVRQIKF